MFPLYISMMSLRTSYGGAGHSLFYYSIFSSDRRYRVTWSFSFSQDANDSVNTKSIFLHTSSLLISNILHVQKMGSNPGHIAETVPGRIVYHSRKIFLKVRNYAYSIIKEIRYKILFCCKRL